LPGQAGYDDSADLKGRMRNVMKTKEYKMFSNEEKFDALNDIIIEGRRNAIKRIKSMPQEMPEIYNWFKQKEKADRIENINQLLEFKKLQENYAE